MEDERRMRPMNLVDIHRKMQQFLSHISQPGGGSRFSACLWEPPVDVYETEDELVVLCELPGIDQDQIELIAEGQTLTIRGERRRAADGSERRYHRMEVCFGGFERVLDLPAQVDAASARAAYRDGFLRVAFRKVYEDPSPRTITVTQG
ncbi:MAG: Hsp20/alpha crystallin family protein [Candidatus Latescibacteria bacterium]|nr:Hsp20/alpha crystallin family protein [Candidatus Latescibacterota bacterium]